MTTVEETKLWVQIGGALINVTDQLLWVKSGMCITTVNHFIRMKAGLSAFLLLPVPEDLVETFASPKVHPEGLLGPQEWAKTMKLY